MYYIYKTISSFHTSFINVNKLHSFYLFIFYFLEIVNLNCR